MHSQVLSKRSTTELIPQLLFISEMRAFITDCPRLSHLTLGILAWRLRMSANLIRLVPIVYCCGMRNNIKKGEESHYTGTS